MEKHAVILVSEDGNSWSTDINGDQAGIVQYFMGNTFNIGRTEDLLVKVQEMTFENGDSVTRVGHKSFRAVIEGRPTAGSLGVICMAFNKEPYYAG